MKNKKMFKLDLFFCLITMMIFAVSAWGEETAKTDIDESTDIDSVHKLEKMIVTGTGKETELLHAPISISIIDKEELRKSTHAQVSDMIQDLPNIEVFDQSIAGMKRVRIRGESASRSVILIDGQRISEQKSMEGAPLLINSNDIERIEVVRGPSSVLYGSDAIGGVINIITKKGGKKPVEGSISSSYNSATAGTNNYATVYGRLDSFEYRLSLAKDIQGDRKTPIGTLENSSSETTSYSGLIGYNSGSVRAGFKYDYYNADINSHTPEELYEEGSDFDYFQLDLPEWSRQKFSLYYSQTNQDSWVTKFDVNAYYQNTYKDFKNDMDINIGLKLRIGTQNDLNTYGLHIQSELVPAENHILVAGINLSHDYLSASGTVRTTWGSYSSPTKDDIKKSKFEAHLTNLAFFLQDEWSLNDFLVVILGVRETVIDGGLDYAKVTGTNLINGYSGPIKVEKNTSQDSHPTGGLTFLIKSRENMTLRLGYIQGYRFPNLQQLYIGTSHGSDTVVYPKSDLKPETSYTIETGIRYYFDSGNFDLTIFNTEAKNYISQKDHPDFSSASIFANINKASSSGAEISAEMMIARLKPYLTIGHIQRKFETETYTTKDVGIPEWKTRIGIKRELAFSSGFQAWFDFFVRGETMARDYDHSEGKTEELAGWQTINMTMGGEMDILKKRFLLTFEALNLADKEYKRAQSSLYEAGRHYVAKISADF